MPQPRAPAPYAILAGYRNRGEFQYGLNTCASQGRLGDDRCQHTNLVTECQDLQLEDTDERRLSDGNEIPWPELVCSRASRPRFASMRPHAESGGFTESSLVLFSRLPCAAFFDPRLQQRARRSSGGAPGAPTVART